jgi:hypothetical protein
LEFLACLCGNASLKTLSIESITNIQQCWKDLHRALLTMLDENKTIQHIHGPRTLVQCPQVQLYLQLNRNFHRKDIGDWVPTLVAHVLAKTHNQEQRGDDDKGRKSLVVGSRQGKRGGIVSSDHHAGATYYCSKSVMFYILRSRPDVVVSR